MTVMSANVPAAASRLLSASPPALQHLQLVRTYPMQMAYSPATAPGQVCSTMFGSPCPGQVLVQPAQWLGASILTSRASPPPLLRLDSGVSSLLSSTPDTTQSVRSLSSASPPPLTSASSLPCVPPPPLSPYVMVRVVPVARHSVHVPATSSTQSCTSLSSVDSYDLQHQRQQQFARGQRTHSLGASVVCAPPLVIRSCRSASDIDNVDIVTSCESSSDDMDIDQAESSSPPPLSPYDQAVRRRFSSSSSSQTTPSRSRKTSTSAAAPRRKRGPYQHFSRTQRVEIAQFASVHGSTCAARHFTQRYSRPVKRSTIDSMVANLKTKKGCSVSEI